METIATYQCTAKTLKAIAHPLRLQILCNLGQQERSVAEIVTQTGSTQSNVSQHLILLREIGVLSARRQANKVFYRVRNACLLNIIRMMREEYCPNAA